MDISKVTQPTRKLMGLRLKRCGAVIVAAGNASRMEGIDKVMAPLRGEPMILHTVRRFQESAVIREIVVVTRPDLLEQVMELCHSFDKVKAVVVGGSSREESVRMGMSVLSDRCKLVAVQDGARPLVSDQVIDRVVRAANAFGAAAPAVPVKDTLKVIRGGLVDHTPDRSALRAVQTPQVFDIDLLRVALVESARNGWAVTDDCSAVERLGMKVRLVEGDERNIKITTPLDLKIAQLLLEEDL